jgi:hypothetical protein
MDVIIKRNTKQVSEKMSRPTRARSVYDSRFGEWGRVDTLHSEDNTVDVFLDSGVYLKRVPVASKEWVISGEDAEKEYNAGERDLPPVFARVFIMMPTFTYGDCFVAPFSGFSTIDQPQPYMEDDREKIKERITPSGWHITSDHVTGSYKAVSPDEKTSLEIDYGNEEDPKEENQELHFALFDEIQANVVIGDETVADLLVFDGEVELTHKKGDSCALKVFDTEIIIKQGEVLIKPKETKIEVDGNLDVSVDGTVTLKCNNSEILEFGNAIATMGKMISDLLQACISFKSFGSPATHTAPEFSATAGQIKALWDQVFA